MRKIQFLLLFFILFLSPKVFAATYNVGSVVEAVPNFGGGTYGGYAKGIALPTYYNINTRYNGQLAMIDFFLDSDDWDWNYNKTYTITLNMATEDWRNNFMGPQVFSAQSNGNTTGSNLYVTNTFRFVSYKQIKFNFKIGSTLGPYIKFRLYSTNTNTTNITGVNNWRLSSISISDVTATPTPTPVTPTPTPTASGASNQDIINSNSQNTSDIINNNNSNTESIIENNTQNTTDIINNNNSNTEQIIDSIKETVAGCEKVDREITVSDSDPQLIGYNLTGTGAYNPNNAYNISEPIPILPNALYTLTASDSNPKNVYFCWYDSSDTPLHCTQYNQQSTWYFHTGETASYIRLTLSSSIANYTLHLESEEICKNKLDSLNDGISSVNDSINNSDIDNGLGGSFFSDFEDQDFGLSSIITIPLNTIQSLTSQSCMPLNIPIPFTGRNVSLPCMTQVYQDNIPSIYNLWKVVSFGIIAYFIAIDIFHMVKGFKDPESDKVEVLDL